MAIIMVVAMVSSTGQFDALCVGAGATITQWVDSTHQTFTASWCLGTEAAQHNVDCFGLAKAAEGTSVKKQPSQDVLHGDAAEEELGLARLVSSYTLPHQNSQPGKRGQQTARSKVLSRHARDT